MEARSEAHRLAGPLECANVSDRLLVAKTLYLPGELLLVRYAVGAKGFGGRGAKRLGRRPFVVFVKDAEPPVAPVELDGSGLLRLRAPRGGGELVARRLLRPRCRRR